MQALRPRHFDLSEAVVANCQNNKDRGEVTLFQADMYDVPCADNRFDFVFCYGVLQHARDSEKIVAKPRPGACIGVDYLKHERLDSFNQRKNFYRRWTVNMPPHKLLSFIRAYIPIWLRFDMCIRRIPFLGPKILDFLRIPRWNYLRSGLTHQQRLEWAILGTFEALSARYDIAPTLEEVRRMVQQVPELDDIYVFYGSNGVVANARRR